MSARLPFHSLCRLLALGLPWVALWGLANLVPSLHLYVFRCLIKAPPEAPLAHKHFLCSSRENSASCPRLRGSHQHRFRELPSCLSSTPLLPSQVIRKPGAPGASGAVPCGCGWLIQPSPSRPPTITALLGAVSTPQDTLLQDTGRPGEHLAGLHEGAQGWP